MKKFIVFLLSIFLCFSLFAEEREWYSTDGHYHYYYSEYLYEYEIESTADGDPIYEYENDCRDYEYQHAFKIIYEYFAYGGYKQTRIFCYPGYANIYEEWYDENDNLIREEEREEELPKD